jgi:hypothetical protein
VPTQSEEICTQVSDEFALVTVCMNMLAAGRAINCDVQLAYDCKDVNSSEAEHCHTSGSDEAKDGMRICKVGPLQVAISQPR